MIVQCQLLTTASHAQDTEPSERPSLAQPPATTGASRTKVYKDLDELSQPVRDMREHILSAVSSRKIEDLRLAIEWNEITPDFSAAAGTSADEAIAYFKRISGEDKGVQILAILGDILNAGFARQPLGPDIENNLVTVWPYFAVIPLEALTPAQRAELSALVSPAAYKSMMAAGRYTGYRLTIGADGTWHEFVKGE